LLPYLAWGAGNVSHTHTLSCHTNTNFCLNKETEREMGGRQGWGRGRMRGRERERESERRNNLFKIVF
jgi:hypothetical protein